MHMLCERVDFINFRSYLQQIVKSAMKECAKDSNPVGINSKDALLLTSSSSSSSSSSSHPRVFNTEDFITNAYKNSDIRGDIESHISEFSSQYIFATGMCNITSGFIFNKIKNNQPGLVQVTFQQEIMPGGRLFVGGLNLVVHEGEADSSGITLALSISLCRIY